MRWKPGRRNRAMRRRLARLLCPLVCVAQAPAPFGEIVWHSSVCGRDNPPGLWAKSKENNHG